MIDNTLTWIAIGICVSGLIPLFFLLLTDLFKSNYQVTFGISLSLIVTGFALGMYAGMEETAMEDKYFQQLKTSIKYMDCKTVRNYVLNNADNETLKNAGVIDYANEMMGATCI